MSYKVAKISPSALAATEACPRFRPDGKDNDAAAEGTLLHECLEKMVQEPIAQWANWIATRAEVSAEHKGLLEEASSQIQSILAGHPLPVFPDFRIKLRNGKPRKTPLKPGIYPECEIERGQGRHGYIDLLIVKPDGFVVIADYKFVRVDGHDYTLQLGAYACDVNRLCPAHKEFECRIIAPRLKSETIESHLWGEEHLVELRKRIDDVEARADRSTNDDSVSGCPGDYCQYCHWSGHCKYQAQTALEVSEPCGMVPEVVKGTPFEGMTLTNRILMAPQNPLERGFRRLFIKFFKSVIEQWTDDDRQWNVDNPTGEVPGWKIGWRKGRASLDTSRMSEIREALKTKLGFDDEGVKAVSKVDVTLLKEYLVENIGHSEKRAAELIQNALDPLMTVGGAYTVWTQDKKRKPATRAEGLEL